MPQDPFWEQPETVEQFADRAPDHRLVRLLDDYDDPAATRVLDLGCAGGRNSVLLVERGFDLHAVDASHAMVKRTRLRVAGLLGPEQARNRVRTGLMDDLSAFADASFDLVIALGIYHGAHSMTEWDRALAETARVPRKGGRLLVNHFTPEVDITGEGMHPVADEPGAYEGMPTGRTVLMDASELDGHMARHGLVSEVPSDTVRVETERGRRVSVNALYRRQR